MGAAQAVLMQGVQIEAPLQIGAAKSWLGHTEAASGIMGLLQAALSMQQLLAPGGLACSSPVLYNGNLQCCLSSARSVTSLWHVNTARCIMPNHSTCKLHCTAVTGS